jgi:hypothetical protein
MDIINTCLNVAPVPYLSAAFSTFRFVYTSVEKTKQCRTQLLTLSETSARLLLTLNDRTKYHRITASSKALVDLERLLDEILRFVKDKERQPFLKALFFRGSTVTQIEAFSTKMLGLVHAFQVEALIDVQALLYSQELARKKDHQDLLNYLNKVVQQPAKLLHVLGKSFPHCVLGIKPAKGGLLVRRGRR